MEKSKEVSLSDLSAAITELNVRVERLESVVQVTVPLSALK